MGVNRAQIIEALLFGYAKPVGSIIPPWQPARPGSRAAPLRPERAKALLAQAGWRDSNGDGILDKGGRPLRFTLSTNAANQLLIDIATVVQSQLKAIGADAQIRTLEFQTLLQQHRGREYEAVLSNWSWDYFRPDPSPLFSCEQARTQSSPNRAGYCNPRADQLMQTALRETDPARARDLWRQYSAILQQDQPITPLYWSEDLDRLRPRPPGRAHRCPRPARQRVEVVDEAVKRQL